MSTTSETDGDIERGAGPRSGSGAGRRKTEADAGRQRLDLLTRVIAVLASPKDETKFEEVARLAVPEIADACTIDLVLEDGRVDRVVALHVDPAQGGGTLSNPIQDATFPKATVMTVPLEARGQTLGELGLFQTKDSGRSFSSWDRSIAKALAMRIALAVDKMRLLAAVREAHAAERRRLSAISHDLRNPLATMIAGVEFLRRTTGREQEHLDGRLEALGAIERSVRLQAKLIDALLDRTSDRAFDQAPDRASDLASDRASDRGSEGAMRPAPAPAEIGLLIVEDNRDTRKLLTYALRSLGYFAQAAGSAEEGLEFLRSEIEFGEAEPSTAPRRRIVILADIGLPGLDGYEFLRRARAMRKERTRAIAVTAWGSPSDVQRAWEAGFDAHFTKPVDIRVLDRTIRKLAGAPSEGASPASGSAAASCPAQAASPAEPPS